MNLLPRSFPADIRSLELSVPDGLVIFYNKVVSCIVYFRLAYFDLAIAILTGNFKQLSDEEMLD